MLSHLLRDGLLTASTFSIKVFGMPGTQSALCRILFSPLHPSMQSLGKLKKGPFLSSQPFWHCYCPALNPNTAATAEVALGVAAHCEQALGACQGPYTGALIGLGGQV